MSDKRSLIRKAENILSAASPVLPSELLSGVVESFLDKRDAFLSLAQNNHGPLYVFDHEALVERARHFQSTFAGEIENFTPFYAVKSNNHPLVSSTLLRSGYGLDVSSGVEFQAALELGAAKILFSGPGKTDDELRVAATHSEHVTILIDSFGELHRLELQAAAVSRTVRAGIRVQSKQVGLWRKFGIPLNDLARFLRQANRCDHVDLCGVQFHTSWNLSPVRQTAFIEELGSAIASLTYRQRQRLTFLDIGGGFWPEQGEWLQEVATPRGRLRAAIDEDEYPDDRHYYLAARTIEEFAAQIAKALSTFVFPHVKCDIYAEPGRWLSHHAMHLLVRVVDRKADDVVVTDGGTNAVGWERFESDYFPVINLSRPSLEEHPCFVFGSLCTPHDIWGYSYFGSDIQPGDVLLIPMQGAYTYSLRQHFIKEVPEVVALDSVRMSTVTEKRPERSVKG